MVCEIKFGAKILPLYGPLNVNIKGHGGQCHNS